MTVGEASAVKIANLPPWHFWARSRSIGTTPEEIQAATPERAQEIKNQLASAIFKLRDMPIPGLQSWMPCHRAMN